MVDLDFYFQGKYLFYMKKGNVTEASMMYESANVTVDEKLIENETKKSLP